MSYKVVFIDWDGTLSLSRFWDHLPNKEYQQIQSAFFHPSNKNALDRWMRGGYSAEQYLQEYNSTDLEKNYLFSELERSAKNMKIFDGAIGLIWAIRQTGTKVVIATDNMDTFVRWTVPSLGLLDKFDDILCSHEVGNLKSDGIFFDSYLQNLSIDPGECVLIDDSSYNHIVTDTGMNYVKIEKRNVTQPLERIINT